MEAKILYKRLGYWQVIEIPDLGNYTLEFAIAIARLTQMNGAEYVHITR
jgi:hypothetical protein